MAFTLKAVENRDTAFDIRHQVPLDPCGQGVAQYPRELTAFALPISQRSGSPRDCPGRLRDCCPPFTLRYVAFTGQRRVDRGLDLQALGNAYGASRLTSFKNAAHAPTE